MRVSNGTRDRKPIAIALFRVSSCIRKYWVFGFWSLALVCLGPKELQLKDPKN